VSLQVLIKGRGGTIESQFLDRQPTSCTVSLYTSQGGAKVSAATCTVDPVNTTLSIAAEAGDDFVVLTSAASCVVGRRYRIGSSTSAGTPETVTVRDLSSSTATLTAPLMRDHALGATFAGTRVSYAVTSTVADVVWVNGYADFEPGDGSDIQSEWVECYLRKIPEQGCDETDLRLVFPAAPTMLEAELDVPAGIKQARDRFLLDLGGKNRPMCLIGTDVFRQAVAIKFWLLRRYGMGDEWKQVMDDLKSEYEKLIQDIQEQVPADNDQDGITSGANDGGFTVGTLERA